MPKIIFITHDAQEYRVAAEPGQSVMQVAVKHDVPGILAECGGCAACATCRLFVDPAWIGLLPAPEALELSMLDCDNESTGGARLSCQLLFDASLDGLTVRIPESQF